MRWFRWILFSLVRTKPVQPTADRGEEKRKIVQDQIKQKNKEITRVIHDDIASAYSLLEKKKSIISRLASFLHFMNI